MANHITYTMTDGEVITLKLPILRGVMLEDWLGMSIQEAGQKNVLEKLSAMLDIVASGTDKERGEGRETAAKIYEDMLANGKTFRDFQFLAFDLLVSAGFVEAATVEAMKSAVKAQAIIMEAAAEKVKKELQNVEQTKE